MSDAALAVDELDVFYGDAQALAGVSLEVPRGAIVALLGPNGAGKTTTLKAVSGLLKTEVGRVTAGRISFDGRRLDGLDPEDIARLGIAQVMEGRRVLEHLTVEENLEVAGYVARGRPHSASANCTRRFWPPDSLPYGRCSRSATPANCALSCTVRGDG